MPDNARPSNRPESLLKSSRAALTFVLLTVFIDSLGFGIIIPSLPTSSHSSAVTEPRSPARLPA